MSSSVLITSPTTVPRPEYPRPDWERSDWLNLNGIWSFRFDPEDKGGKESWQTGGTPDFDSSIIVPFSWASPLSGIGEDVKGIGWYHRVVSWKPVNSGDRIFLRFGAVDYECDVWVNGVHAGSHSGGYGTFEFDVTGEWRCNADNDIVVRVEDFDRNHQARGKQGYGEIRGIWQPVWLEARPQNYLRDARFITHIDGSIEVNATIFACQAQQSSLLLSFADGEVSHQETVELKEGLNHVQVSFTVGNPQLWSPESPHLYEGEVKLSFAGGEDAIRTYFGIREISTARFGERNYRWITLNGKPVYLNGTLDQSYHPTGYFTYPTDDEMRDEIYLMKRLGLNFVRIHIKPEEPRKLYWADKLGILVMEDMPCFWGDPDDRARASYEREAREIIERDFNHPSIFSWVMFNETWGLKTESQASSLTSDQKQPNNYLPDTQEWVRRMYYWAKQVDPTRIVEDNSPCNWDHVETDINTWHFYINGYEEVRRHVSEVVEKTFPGSAFNCIGDNVQTDAPLMNSECGNVWGIDGGAGDSDLAWHYRYMMNEFRRHDQMCGFVFTEFRDVTNEFNGYYRLDGSDKKFGYEWFVPGMTIADLHTLDFIVIDAPPCQTIEAGKDITISLLRSSFSDRYFGQQLELAWELWYDNLGTRRVADSGSVALDWEDYGVTSLQPLNVRMPEQDAVAVLALQLKTRQGDIVTRNFTVFDVRSNKCNGVYESDGAFISVPVGGFAEQTWPYQWSAIQSHKVSGGPSGSFVYEVQLPDRDEKAVIYDIEIIFEASAKRLLARNIEEGEYRRPDISFMHGAKAGVEYNPNTYYMTDAERHESSVNVLIDGERITSLVLPDDPADSRGVLSWHYQPVANKLDEAGSYGYLCKVTIPSRLAAKLDQNRVFKLELEAKDGGLALYGRNAGRYPVDLTIRYQ
jgi:hypothetical protein